MHLDVYLFSSSSCFGMGFHFFFVSVFWSVNEFSWLRLDWISCNK